MIRAEEFQQKFKRTVQSKRRREAIIRAAGTQVIELERTVSFSESLLGIDKILEDRESGLREGQSPRSFLETPRSFLETPRTCGGSVGGHEGEISLAGSVEGDGGGTFGEYGVGSHEPLVEERRGLLGAVLKIFRPGLR